MVTRLGRGVTAVVAAVSLGACTLFWPLGDHELRAVDGGTTDEIDGGADAVGPDSAADSGSEGGSTAFTEPEIVASVTPSPRLLALNATYAFVVGLDETVLRITKATRAVEALPTPSKGYAGKPIAMTGLGADSQWVFLTGSELAGCGVPAFAWKRAVGDAGVFLEVSGGCAAMTALANDPLDMAFTLGYGATSQLLLHPLGGGSSHAVAGDLPEATALYSLPDEVYLASSSTKRVVRIAKTADAGTDLATTIGSPRDIVADATNVYWIEDQGLVAIKPRAAAVGDATTTLANEPVGLTKLAQDATRLYFTNLVDGTVRTIPKAGGAAITIGTKQGEPVAIAVDDSGVYWVNRGSGTLMRSTAR